MNKAYALSIICACVAFGTLPASAHAYYYPYDDSRIYDHRTSDYSAYDASALTSLQARLRALILEVERLEQELARTRTVTPYPLRLEYNCDGYSRNSYYYRSDRLASDYKKCGGYSENSLRRVEVDFEHTYARVHIEYRNGRSVSRIYAADTEEEVIQFLMSETGASRTQIVSVTDFNGRKNRYDYTDEDVDTIRVTINREDDEARARVRYDDGSTDTFNYDTDVKSEIVSELSDDLDMDENDIEDIVEYSYTTSSL